MLDEKTSKAGLEIYNRILRTFRKQYTLAFTFIFLYILRKINKNELLYFETNFAAFK